MKISFSKDYGTFNFSIDEENLEQDLENCQKIERLMASPDWPALLELFLLMRGKYDETVMRVKPAEQSFRENAIYAARLGGFWSAVQAPEQVKQAYHLKRKEKIKELEELVENRFNDGLSVNGEL